MWTLKVQPQLDQDMSPQGSGVRQAVPLSPQGSGVRKAIPLESPGGPWGQARSIRWGLKATPLATAQPCGLCRAQTYSYKRFGETKEKEPPLDFPDPRGGFECAFYTRSN